MNFLTRTREQSIEWAKRMTMMEGIMVGPSSGAVMKVYVSSYSYVCPHTPICLHILLYMRPHTTIYVSSYCYMCPHTAIYVSSYCYICVLILLHMSPHTPMFVE